MPKIETLTAQESFYDIENGLDQKLSVTTFSYHYYKN